MSNYTCINLNELPNQAPNHGMPEEMEARFAARDLGLEKSGASLQRLQPGFRVPFGHAHSEQEELYLVLRGSARIKLDDEIVELDEYDAVRIGPGVMRNMEAGPDGVEWVAFGAPAVEDKAAEADMRQGWWRD